MIEAPHPPQPPSVAAQTALREQVSQCQSRCSSSLGEWDSVAEGMVRDGKCPIDAILWCRMTRRVLVKFSV